MTKKRQVRDYLLGKRYLGLALVAQVRSVKFYHSAPKAIAQENTYSNDSHQESF